MEELAKTERGEKEAPKFVESLFSQLSNAGISNTIFASLIAFEKEERDIVNVRTPHNHVLNFF